MNDPQAQVAQPGTQALETTPPDPQAQLPANGEGVQQTQDPGNAEGEPQGQTSENANIQNLHRMLNERQVMNYQLQQRLEMLESRVQQPQQTQQENPYDYQTQFPMWQRWENQLAARSAAVEANQALMMQLQQMAMQNTEQQWQSTHPDINIGEVKAFARMRWGVPNVTEQVLNDAYSMMTQDYQINRTRTNAVNQAFTQFKNTSPSATSMRSGQAPPVTPQIKFADDLKAWNDTDGRVEETWSPERRAAFHAELNTRKTNPQAG